MKGKRLLANTIYLTVTSLVLRFLSLGFQIYLSKQMGASGVGIFYLILSVNSFAATVAISGIRFATTRLVSEEFGKIRGNIRAVVKRCMVYAVLVGSAAAAALYMSAGVIGERVINDTRTVLPLKILSVSLPFIPIGAALGGYFTGTCRVNKPAIANVAEQVIKIAVSVFLMSSSEPGNVGQMCVAAAIGQISGEILSTFLIMAFYIKDKYRLKLGNHGNASGVTRHMLGIAAPLALTAYARTALNAVQNLLIPKGLTRSGKSSETALADYGTIQGMVFPIMTFPAVIFASISELIVPELTEEQVRGRYDRISETANILLRLCLMFSIGVMGALICFSNELGDVIYSNGDVGRYIRLLAALMPIMYMDTVTDGMLRGLGEHLYAMGVNIIDSLLSTALIYFLLPKYAVYGYIFILYASEIFNFYLSIKRLSKKAEIRIEIKDLLRTTIAAFSVVNISESVTRICGGIFNVTGLVSGIIMFFIIYLAFLFVFRAIGKKEIALMKSVIK